MPPVPQTGFVNYDLVNYSQSDKESEAGSPVSSSKIVQKAGCCVLLPICDGTNDSWCTHYGKTSRLWRNVLSVRNNADVVKEASLCAGDGVLWYQLSCWWCPRMASIVWSIAYPVASQCESTLFALTCVSMNSWLPTWLGHVVGSSTSTHLRFCTQRDLIAYIIHDSFSRICPPPIVCETLSTTL